MARRTIFDDVFRTMCQKMPYLLIPLINEIFMTNYSEEVEVKQLRNEHFVRNGEIITDALVEIERHTYHIECQSKDDSTMVIRMVEYDFSIALEGIQHDGTGRYRVDFPESCVVYLRASDSASRHTVVEIHFPNGQVFQYKMKSICVQDYTQDEIFQKKLLMFLPFYILRHEKELSSVKKEDEEKLELLLDEYGSLFKKLENACVDSNIYGYTDLYNLLIKIVNYVVKSSKVKRRFAAMGGRVLQLESERLEKKGRVAGRAEGRAEGLNILASVIKQLKSGTSEATLIKEGIAKSVIDLAKTCL